jgi:hypothetical protein
MSNLDGASGQVVDLQTEITEGRPIHTQPNGPALVGHLHRSGVEHRPHHFPLQNIRSVAVTFLWMWGNVPLGLGVPHRRYRHRHPRSRAR